MRVALGTVTVDDDYRRIVACWDGDHRKIATRDRIRRLVLAVGASNDDDMRYEWEHCPECSPRRRI